MDFKFEGDPYNSNKLTDFEEYLKNKPLDVEMSENSSREADSSNNVKNTSSDTEQKYALHDGTTRGLFFYWSLQKGLSVCAAASRANVSHSTANNWYQKYLSDPDNYEMEKKTNRSNRPASKLQEPHKRHLIDFFDENPSAVITDVVESLTAAFEGLAIKKSGYMNL